MSDMTPDKDEIITALEHRIRELENWIRERERAVGGTVSYATEEEKDEQRALAERARQTIAKRRSER